MIEIRNVFKSFREQRVLSGVDLTIEDGKITSIMGSSGVGKSVLLKHLIGLIHPDRGEIFVDGEEITHLPSKEMNRIRRKFGMLFQDAALFDDMTVFENVSFPLFEHTQLSDQEIEGRVTAMLEEVGLVGIEEKLPNELSGGMRKRVGLARALMLDPKILLFDEPTTGLDPIITSQITELIRETHRRHKVTVVLISHDLALSYDLADKIAMLHEGKIVEVAPPTEFRRSRHPFVRQFIETQGRAGRTA
ncbi:MAG TPA: ABC transporter ATP-binding protein [Bdellovibrionota bacterium]|nr:ABC transporter ATP-binding protein [Bdellovibrionota bacterium]